MLTEMLSPGGEKRCSIDHVLLSIDLAFRFLNRPFDIDVTGNTASAMSSSVVCSDCDWNDCDLQPAVKPDSTFHIVGSNNARDNECNGINVIHCESEAGFREENSDETRLSLNATHKNGLFSSANDRPSSGLSLSPAKDCCRASGTPCKYPNTFARETPASASRSASAT